MWFASPVRRRAAESYTRSDDGYRRYGHVSTVLTSNRGFEEWGRILGDEVMAASLPDRLLHRARSSASGATAARMRRHAELSKAIHPVGSRTKWRISCRGGHVVKPLRQSGSRPATRRYAPSAGQLPNSDIVSVSSHRADIPIAVDSNGHALPGDGTRLSFEPGGPALVAFAPESTIAMGTGADAIE